MVQLVDVGDQVKRLSSEELGKIIRKCETAIVDGSAEIEDYEAFVLCQQELARRMWSQA